MSIFRGPIWIVIITIIIVPSCVIQDDDTPDRKDTYVKYYGEAGEQRMVDMVYNGAGHIVMLGAQKKSIAGSNFDFLLVEADTFGNQLGPAVAIDVAFLLQDTTKRFTEEDPQSIVEIDGGYLVVGTYNVLKEGSALESNIFWARLNE